MNAIQYLILEYSNRTFSEQRQKVTPGCLAVYGHVTEVLSIKPTDRQTLNTFLKNLRLEHSKNHYILNFYVH